MKEICICAAVKAKDGRIIRANRHNECFWLMMFHNLDPKGRIEGFITSTGRFVDRKEALVIQKAAGIQSKYNVGYHGDELFSEDLY